MEKQVMTAMQADERLLHQIDALRPSARLSKEREEFFKCELEITGDRSALCVESWLESQGESVDVRWARLVEKWAERMPIVIFQDQLVVGSQTKLFRGADPWVEYETPNVLEIMESENKGVRQSAARLSHCEDEEWGPIEEAVRFFLGKSPVDAIFKGMADVYQDWPEDLEKARGILRHGRYNNVAPMPQWEKLLGSGLRAVIDQAKDGLDRVRSGAEPDAGKAWFWQAAIICCEAVIAVAHRYARLAQEMAGIEQDKDRKQDLKLIAEACRRVPEFPARTLQEAVQSRLIFGMVMMWCRPNAVPDDSGRMDQYLYPYFISDVRNGAVSLERASDLVGSLLSNVARRDGAKSKQRGQYAQGALISNVVLGGQTATGEDASNELTNLILHLAGQLRYAEPHYTFRVNDKTPKWALLKAIDTNKKVGGGQPQFMSDSRVTQYFLRQGEALEDARDWVAHHCMNPVAGGRRGSRVPMRPAAQVNMPLVLDMALHNGVAPVSGKQLGVETGEARLFGSFDDLWAAYRKQMEFLVSRLNVLVHVAHRVDEEMARFPLWSVLANGCMENGKDFIVGGVYSYKNWDWKDRGHVDAADSLAAIKTLVFEQGKLTMTELLEAIDSNFAGIRGEEIRQMCLRAPKYGNGLQEADRMVRESGRLMGEIIHRYKNPLGGPYSIVRHGLSWHYYAGKGVGALPNGRKSGEPLNDGSLSPMKGMDRHGITGVLRSALNAGFDEAVAAVLNQKFPVTLMQSPESAAKLADLTQTFLTSGGSHIQYNILDRQTLLDARQHPERYRDLVVRVAGYSAYWVHLTPEIQDDVICRTEQSLAG
ncbi:MAG: hypothetical protein HYX90_07355 [Chloroflexi bacterium]|nr:hypothetical protein [Chloroflexota bacterium]